MIGEMQIPVRKVIPWQVDASRKAVGLNPGADKGFFTHEISVVVYWYPFAMEDVFGESEIW